MTKGGLLSEVLIKTHTTHTTQVISDVHDTSNYVSHIHKEGMYMQLAVLMSTSIVNLHNYCVSSKACVFVLVFSFTKCVCVCVIDT